MTPEWLKQRPKITACSCCAVSGKKNFLARTIDDLRGFMIETILLETSASQPGLLQSLSPNLKMIGLAVTLILLSVSRHLAFIALIYLFIVTLAFLSRLKPSSFFGRTLVPAFFFAFLVILPAAFSPITPGPSLITIWHQASAIRFGPFTLPAALAVTRPGLMFVGLFFLRALAMISASILVLQTTKVAELFNAMAALGLPATFILILQMTYRFVFTLVRLVENTHLAKKSRTIKLGPNKVERAWTGRQVGWTLKRALDMSEQVTQAMIARGWSGKVHRTRFRIAGRDLAAATLFTGLIISFAWLGG